MGRYATSNFQILTNKRNGQLKGINFGYGYYSEHERGYSGSETFDYENKQLVGPFIKETIKNPSQVKFFRDSKNRVMLSSDSFLNRKVKTNEDLIEFIDASLSSDDNFMTTFKKEEKFYAYWSDDHFYIIGLEAFANDLLEKLYDNIQRENIAVSSDFSGIFDDRGLSFVVLNQLEPVDFAIKRASEVYEYMLEEQQKKYKQYLKDNGMHFFSEKKKEYPFELFNVQIQGIDMTSDDEISPYFYVEIYDNIHLNSDLEGRRDFYSNISRRLTGLEIEFLVGLAQDAKFTEYANNNSFEDTEKYIIELLEEERKKSHVK